MHANLIPTLFIPFTDDCSILRPILIYGRLLICITWPTFHAYLIINHTTFSSIIVLILSFLLFPPPPSKPRPPFGVLRRREFREVGRERERKEGRRGNRALIWSSARFIRFLPVIFAIFALLPNNYYSFIFYEHLFQGFLSDRWFWQVTVWTLWICFAPYYYPFFLAASTCPWRNSLLDQKEKVVFFLSYFQDFVTLIQSFRAWTDRRRDFAFCQNSARLSDIRGTGHCPRLSRENRAVKNPRPHTRADCLSFSSSPCPSLACVHFYENIAWKFETQDEPPEIYQLIYSPFLVPPMRLNPNLFLYAMLLDP